MRRSVTAGAVATIAVAAGIGAAVGIAGGQDNVRADSPPVRADAGELQVRAQKGGKKSQPVFTHLITKASIPVPHGSSTYTGLKCPRKFGSPVSGGVSTNGAAFFAQSIASVFDPNDLQTENRTFFVGARNDSGEPQSFDGNVVCVKKAKVR